MFENLDLTHVIFGMAGVIVTLVGGKAMPFLRILSKQTPTPIDDEALKLLQKFIDAEATKPKK